MGQEIVTVFLVDCRSEYRLPNPAPPPKLLCSTLWRSITRRMYDKRAAEIILSARALSEKFRMNRH